MDIFLKCIPHMIHFVGTYKSFILVFLLKFAHCWNDSLHNFHLHLDFVGYNNTCSIQ